MLATARAAEIIGELEAARPVSEAPLRERRWGQLCSPSTALAGKATFLALITGTDAARPTSWESTPGRSFDD